jgi:hypothetical protein
MENPHVRADQGNYGNRKIEPHAPVRKPRSELTFVRAQSLNHFAIKAFYSKTGAGHCQDSPAPLPRRSVCPPHSHRLPALPQLNMTAPHQERRGPLNDLILFRASVS